MRNRTNYETKVTVWEKWEQRNELEGIGCSGVYFCALSKRAISGRKFSLRKEIIYIGMSNNAKNGIETRLNQLHRSISARKRGHSGGRKMWRDHGKNPEKFIRDLFVAIDPFTNEVKAKSDEDEKIIKRTLITKIEHDFLAEYFCKFGFLPKYNGKP